MRKIEERLHFINYYRLSAYWYPFWRRLDDGTRLDEFEAGTCWERVMAYYMFDRKLRNLVFDAIARIEISLRTLVAYYWAQESGRSNPQGMLSQYKDSFTVGGRENSRMEKFLGEVGRYYAKSSTECAKHHRDDLGVMDARDLPVWVFVEFTTMGNLTFLISKGLKKKLVATIARDFGFSNGDVFTSAIALLKDVRNSCAHQARIWNRRWLGGRGDEIFKIPRSDEWKLMWDSTRGEWSLPIGGAHLFAEGCISRTALVLTLCHLMLKHIAPESKWDDRLNSVLDYGGKINRYIYRELGFGTPEWRSHPLWN